MTKEYKISEISKITGFSISTLRYYEKLNLLKSSRDVNNYRVFTEQDLRWIDFIKRAKETGMSLAKIITYSELREKGNSTIDQRIVILDEQEKTLDKEKEKIQSHINFLKNKKEYYKKLKRMDNN